MEKRYGNKAEKKKHYWDREDARENSPSFCKGKKTRRQNPAPNGSPVEGQGGKKGSPYNIPWGEERGQGVP